MTRSCQALSHLILGSFAQKNGCSTSFGCVLFGFFQFFYANPKHYQRLGVLHTSSNQTTLHNEKFEKPRMAEREYGNRQGGRRDVEEIDIEQRL